MSSERVTAFPKGGAKFKLLTIRELEDLPGGEWLIDGLFESSSLVMLYGSPGSGKSFLSLSMALSIASGKDWNGRRVKAGSVVYVAGEGGRGILKRIHAWQQHTQTEAVDDAFFVLTAPQLRTEGDRLGFVSSIEKLDKRPALVVLDPFARTFVGGDENSSNEIGQWVEAAASLQKLGATVLFVHHTVKKSPGRGRPKAERGSGALRAGVDTAIAVDRAGDILKVSCEKQKDQEEFEAFRLEMRVVSLDASGQPAVTSLVLVPRGETEVESGDGPAERLNDPHLEALRTLADAGVPLKSGDWRARIAEKKGKEVPEKTYQNWRKELFMGDYVSLGEEGYQLTPKGATAIGMLNEKQKQAA